MAYALSCFFAVFANLDMRVLNYSTLPLLFMRILTTATPLQSKSALKIKHELSSIPKQWSRSATPSSDHILNLRIGLKQSRADKLIDQLHKISDPDHKDYGNHLSSAELRSFIQPSDDSIMLVKDWLTEHGFNDDDISFSSHRDWINLKAPMDVVERMLGAEYHVYEHDNGLDKTVRTLSYSLPEYLHDHIDVVHPTTYFYSSRRKPMKEAAASGDMQGLQQRSSMIVNSDNEMIPINIFRVFYKTIDYVPKAADKNKIAVLGFDDENAIYTDLALFVADERPDAIGADFNYVLINNGTNDQDNPGVGEANLDIQTVIGVTYPIPTDFYSIGGDFIPDPSGENDAAFIQLIEYLLSLPDDKLPLTITGSYGYAELTFPPEYAKRVCDGFAQLGARGVSILFSSGDYGVGIDEMCIVEENGVNRTVFQPLFPASCPFVTSVGATRDFFPEVAEYEDYYSGGGFSDLFSRPSYQDEFVSKYLRKIGDLNQGLYNSSGRGYPDVAAQGHNYKIYTESAPEASSGTSASTPLFAGVVTLLNDYLISQNKKPLGFLNPFLYKKGYKGLHDIIQGASEGCNTTGFPAMPGWDAVTGLGTPDFQKLLKILEHS